MGERTRRARLTEFGRLLPGGIRARLLLLIVMAVLPLLLLVVAVYLERIELRRLQTLQGELEVAHGIGAIFEAHVETVWQHSQLVGEAILAFERDPAERAAHLLATAVRHLPTVLHLSWVAPDGALLISSEPALVGQVVSLHGHVPPLQEGATWALAPLMPEGLVKADAAFTIATALWDDEGVFSGVLLAGMDPDRLGEVLRTGERPEEGTYAIFDSNGVLVYRNPEQPLSWRERHAWRQGDPVLNDVLATGQPQSGVIEMPLTGDANWAAARVPLPATGWVAAAGRPMAVAMAPVYRRLPLDIAIAMSVALLSFLIAQWVAATISRPLQRLQQEAAFRVNSETLSADERPSAPLEIRHLRATVATMANDLVRRAELLRDREQSLRQLADAMPQLVWSARADGQVDYYNQRYRDYHGIEQVQEQEWAWGPVLHPDDVEPTVTAWETAVATGEPYQVEHRVQMSDGTYRWHLSRGLPVKDAHGAVVKWFGTATDIHALKQVQLQREQLVAELARSNRELEQFAYVASHDLQEPLRMVASYMQLFERKYRGQLDERAELYIHYAVDGAQRMQKLIEGLLAYSRINRRGGAFRPVATGPLCESAIANLKAAIDESGARVACRDLPTVVGDELQLGQLLQNLIGNAVKYRRPDVPPEVEVGARREGDAWIFWVRDNGIGIDPAYEERIFQIFQRLHTRDEYPGTGIGLALCRRIVERHHGRIWMESTPGVGSTFYFTLPTGETR